MHFSCVELVLLLYTRACDFIMRLHPDLFILMCLFVLKKIKKEEERDEKEQACMECS